MKFTSTMNQLIELSLKSIRHGFSFLKPLYIPVLVLILASDPISCFAQPDPPCVCASCGRKCGSGHASNCPYNNNSSDNGSSNSGVNFWQARREANEIRRHDNAMQFNNRGNEEYKKGNWEEAVKFYRKALRNAPDDQVIRNNLKSAEEYYDREKATAKQKKDKEKEDREWEKQQQKLKEDAAKREKENAERELKLLEDQKKRAIEQQRIKEKEDKALTEKKLQEAQQKINALQKDISHIQQTLKMYSKGLQNNGDEFEKWGNTVDAAYKAAIENAKNEVKDYFIGFTLAATLGPKTQKLAFDKIRAILQSNDPQLQKWLAIEAKLKGVTPDKVEDLIDKVSKGFDLNDLLQGEQSGIKPKLDAMLFTHSLFEAFDILDYKTLMKKQELFGADKLAGEYFDKAKLIGETYADLTSICYSWYMIKKLTADNEQFAQKISLLSYNMEYEMKQMDCLKKCIHDYSNGCIEKCTGVTRLSTPPPLLR